MRERSRRSTSSSQAKRTRHGFAPCLIHTDPSSDVAVLMPSSWLCPSRNHLISHLLVTGDCRSLGLLNYVRVWHDNSGKGASASWFLKYIIVRDLQTMQKSYFICQNWLAVEKDTGTVSSSHSELSADIRVHRSSVWCPWLVMRRNRSSRMCCRNRPITVSPKVICGSRSSLVRPRIGSRECSDAPAVSCCC
jgi:PLAT/LH2 domain